MFSHSELALPLVRRKKVIALELCTLASGSSGNCLLVRTEQARILVDAGISCKRICQGLASLGVSPELLDGILITHEHTDHIAGLAVFLRKYHIPVYTSAPTGRQLNYRIAGVEDLITPIRPGEKLFLQDLEITAFSTPHDAAGSLGFTFASGGKKLAVVTDLGRVTDEVLQAVLGSDLVLMEANYEEDWLLDGPYPYPLKQRILGDRGHLSNVDSGALACLLANNGTKGLILGHLSKENNSPQRALDTVVSCLEGQGCRCGKDLWVEVAPRSERGPVWQV